MTAENDGDSAFDEANISSAQQILNQGAGKYTPHQIWNRVSVLDL